MTIPVVAVVGPSNGGKTRVAAALIGILASRYRIAAVKHCPHGHQVDRPASDSARLYAEGAIQVILSSPGQVTSIKRTEADMTLERIVATLDPSYDLVVAEGFKDSSVPKVLVAPNDLDLPRPSNVFAVVGNGGKVTDTPRYSFEELDRLASQIEDQMLGRVRRDHAISILADGVPIPLKSFPANALAGVVRGFLKALRDVPQSTKEVHIVMSTEQIRDGQRKSADLKEAYPSHHD